MTAHVLYFHGFASSPRSQKGLAVGALLAADVRSYQVVDLQGPDFTAMTMHGIRSRAVAAAQALPVDGAPLLVVGSSLGGYVAALLAAERALPRLRGMVLVAPAFAFPSRWRALLGADGIERWRREGTRMFFHHGAERELPLGYGFYESCVGLPDIPAAPGVAVAIVHGRGDETVDWRGSLTYAQAHAGVELHLVDGDHRLVEPRHEELIAWSVRDLLGRAQQQVATA